MNALTEWTLPQVQHARMRAYPVSFRKLARIDPRHQLQRVLVINLLQHLIRQIKTIEPPESVAFEFVKANPGGEA